MIDQELRAKRCDLLANHAHNFPGQRASRRGDTGELRWAFHSIEREQCARLAVEIPAQTPERTNVDALLPRSTQMSERAVV